MKKSPAHLQRRWREVPKDELDAIRVTRTGKPVLITEEERKASEFRKRNKQLEGRRKAAKKKTSE
jgi:hypothetical protein